MSICQYTESLNQLGKAQRTTMQKNQTDFKSCAVIYPSKNERILKALQAPGSWCLAEYSDQLPNNNKNKFITFVFIFVCPVSVKCNQA